MKLVIALFVFSAGVAAAEPVALDYRANDPECINAGRFADEVSAKLGFVPWDPRAGATLRIRVERNGNHFTGSLRNPDGTAKIVDGATCAEVTANLVMTTAVALDLAPGPAPAPPPPAPAKSDRVVVQQEYRRFQWWLPLASLGGGVALAVAGTGLYAAGVSDRNAYNTSVTRCAQMNQSGGCPPGSVSTKPLVRARELSAAGITFWSVGGAAALAAGLLTYLNRPTPVHAEAPDAKHSGDLSIQFLPAIAPDYVGATIGGTFR